MHIKEKLETQYQMEYGVAVQQRDRQQQELNRIGGLIREENQVFFEKQSVAFRIRDLTAVQNKIAYLKAKEKEAAARLYELEDQVVRKRDRLSKAMQERKTYEILREKALEAYYEEEKQEAMKLIDEQVSFKYSRE
ncbi:hypothetical protein C3V36_13460 [Lachnospiraceae bacterium oral taxon 500]|nr:hypothetical protein C3V36_13460 [Lachnospiraceae bacterium oral taxon 500]